ncbi:MAG: hypothetical protein ACD_19C00187G0034 [uncultured bacterium]|nr:MAG: hypothetical protein ACD_19C00187G0034 [uncultured bacterium]
MAEGSGENIVENKIEDPQMKVEIKLSKNELLKQMPPYKESPTVATRWIYDQAENVFNYGIDAPGSEENIMPRVLWEMHAFPSVYGLENRGEDMTEIFIYKNESFLLPSNGSSDKVMFVEMATREKKEISVVEALEKKYPTLRDIFVGQIEVRYV